MKIFEMTRRRKRRKLAKKGFAQTQKVRRKDPSSIKESSKRKPYKLTPFLVLLMIWGVGSFTICYKRAVPKFDYIVGQKADKYILSTIEFEYVNHTATETKRREAAAKAAPVYSISKKTVEASIDRTGELKKHLKQLTSKEDEGTADISKEAPFFRINSLSAEDFALLKDVSPLVLQGVLNDAILKIRKGLISAEEKTLFFSGGTTSQQITITDSLNRRYPKSAKTLVTPVEAAREILAEEKVLAEKSEAVLNVLENILLTVLVPNLEFSEEGTEDARRIASEQIAEIRSSVKEDEPLISSGNKITLEDLEKLEAYRKELQKARSFNEVATDYVLYSLLCLFLVLTGVYFLNLIYPSLSVRLPETLMVGIILCTQMLINRIVTDTCFAYGASQLITLSILPLAFGAMLLAQLEGNRVAIVGAVFTSAVCAFYHQEHVLPVLIGGTLSSLAAAFLMKRARKRLHAYRAGFAAGAVYFMVSLIFLLLKTGFETAVLKEALPYLALMPILTGIVLSIVASALLPLFEFAFGVTTDMSLLELSDLNHPLLKRLQMEAPGTYHHSLMVAMLAEQAAEAIGANPLLARVSSYFHDIGKLQHPDYFTENCWGEDPHRELQPRLSSLVILNHVKEGIDLALKYKLKKPIRESIAQHHGTNLVFYFYQRALERNENGKVGEHEYRYPGPLPKRREIVIISLADPCEAASRSLEKPSPQKISALVEEITNKRIRDGQLDQADLTLNELRIVKQTLSKSLGTMYHGRIKYPTEKSSDEIDLFKVAEDARNSEQKKADHADKARNRTDPS